jgi:hypothetical protein
MACVAFNGRLHDTVSETSFGPQCRDDDEADALLCHIYRTRSMDPRACERTLLDAALDELRSGRATSMLTHPRVLCACGSGELFHSTTYHRGSMKTHCKVCGGTEVPADRRGDIGRF